MNDPDTLRELFDHMQWADALVWTAALVADAGATHDQTLQARLFHIHMVQQSFLAVWQERPLGPPPRADIPDLPTTLGATRRYYDEVAAFLSTLDEGALRRPVVLPWAGRFAARLGREPSVPTLAETLLQVAMHSTYHRGQVNARLRELGTDPPLTDYIAWVWFDRPVAAWPASEADGSARGRDAAEQG